jgi:F-type H+-transporting ATPase subunit b
VKLLHAIILLLLVIPILETAVAAAQHESAPQKPAPHEQGAQAGQQQEPDHGAAQAATGKAEKAGAQEFGAELAEASREAAGEDEHAEFKQSAAVRWISSITGLPPKGAYWLAIALNFAVIALLIILFAKSQLPNMVRARTAAIQKSMEEARRASEDANRRLTEIESRLSKLDSEISAMRAAAEAEARAEEERIQAAAEEDKRKIVTSAEQEIAAITKLARRDLKAYTAELAVTLAEKQIRVDAPTDQALVREFVDQLGKDGR